MKKITVLIAKDDIQSAEVVNKFVQRLDAFIVCGIAQSLMQARDMTEVIKPDLIILDSHFHDGEGVDLLQFVQRKNLKSETIMLTEPKDNITINKLLHRELFDFIVKPINLHSLGESLKNYQNNIHNTYRPQLQNNVAFDSNAYRTSNHSAITEKRLPKGIDALTLEKIRQQLKNTKTPFTVIKIGTSVGISRTTSRRYLEYLVGLNEIAADVNYGGIGRPERIYTNNVGLH